MSPVQTNADHLNLVCLLGRPTSKGEVGKGLWMKRKCQRRVTDSLLLISETESECPNIKHYSQQTRMGADGGGGGGSFLLFLDH